MFQLYNELWETKDPAVASEINGVHDEGMFNTAMTNNYNGNDFILKKLKFDLIINKLGFITIYVQIFHIKKI
jgi:hypothetical protein